MNLYLISQTVNNDYDTYGSAVVAALNEDDARNIHPRGDIGSWGSGGMWAKKEDIKVELIGVAEKTAKRIVCTSFRAG